MKHDKPPCVKPLMLRLPEELHEKIEAAASNEGRSLANMTRRILERWVAEQQAAA
jgi:predicted HicB family RNase H-like nuclease